MSQASDVRIFATPADLFQAAAAEFQKLAQEAVQRTGRFTVALSGGSTPKKLFALLAQIPESIIPWTRVFFFFGDERHVPPDDPESNFRMANESLLSKIHAWPENVFRIRAELDAEAAAENYEEQLIKFFGLQPGEFPHFDLIMLGLGPDGHTASLFPETKALNESNRLVASNWVPKFNTYRITFTYPVINQAAAILFLVTGPDKADAVYRCLLDRQQGPPAGRVEPVHGELEWFLDQEAAAKLPADFR